MSAPMREQRLTARFKKGDAVRWNALALHGSARDGWIVDGFEVQDDTLLPIYRVSHPDTKQRGSAVQNELEPQPVLAKKANGNTFKADLARLDQIRRAHASARPTTANPAWMNSHHDETFLLSFIDKLWSEYCRTLAELDNRFPQQKSL